MTRKMEKISGDDEKKPLPESMAAILAMLDANPTLSEEEMARRAKLAPNTVRSYVQRLSRESEYGQPLFKGRFVHPSYLTRQRNFLVFIASSPREAVGAYANNYQQGICLEVKQLFQRDAPFANSPLLSFRKASVVIGGPFDILVEMVAGSDALDLIGDLVTNHIRPIKGVTMTQTAWVNSITAQEYLILE